MNYIIIIIKTERQVYTYTSPLLRLLAAGVFRSSVLDTLPLELPPHALSSLSEWCAEATVDAVTSVMSNGCAVGVVAADVAVMPNDDSSGWLMDTVDMAIGLTDMVVYTAVPVNAGFSTPWQTPTPPAIRRWLCNVPDRLGSISWIGDNTTCDTAVIITIFHILFLCNIIRITNNTRIIIIYFVKCKY